MIGVWGGVKLIDFEQYDFIFEQYDFMFEQYDFIFEQYDFMFGQYDFIFGQYALMFDQYYLISEQYYFISQLMLKPPRYCMTRVDPPLPPRAMTCTANGWSCIGAGKPRWGPCKYCSHESKLQSDGVCALCLQGHINESNPGYSMCPCAKMQAIFSETIQDPYCSKMKSYCSNMKSYCSNMKSYCKK